MDDVRNGILELEALGHWIRSRAAETQETLTLGLTLETVGKTGLGHETTRLGALEIRSGSGRWVDRELEARLPLHGRTGQGAPTEATIAEAAEFLCSTFESSR